MTEVAKSRANVYSLNLLWTVPLAVAIAYFPAAIVRFQRCGLHECLGEAAGFASPLVPAALGVAILGALAMVGAVAVVPWLRPARLRLLIALATAVFVFAVWVWVILFQ